MFKTLLIRDISLTTIFGDGKPKTQSISDFVYFFLQDELAVNIELKQAENYMVPQYKSPWVSQTELFRGKQH